MIPVYAIAAYSALLIWVGLTEASKRANIQYRLLLRLAITQEATYRVANRRRQMAKGCGLWIG